MSFKFELIKECNDTKARVGRLHTPQVLLKLQFYACGTQATVKALSPEELEDLGAQIILSNTYHLYLDLDMI